MPAADLVVLWRVFEHCNLACRFCGYSTSIRRPRIVADPELVLCFGKILGDYARAHGRSVAVSWLGGEPLLWPALPALSHQYRHTFGVGVGVTTNGEPLASPSVRASLDEDYSLVTVSADGVGGFHDTCRSSPGLFDRIKRSVCALRAEADADGSGLVFSVNTILMRGNVAEFERLCREVASWGVTELTFNQLGGNDRPEFYPDNRLLPEQVERFAAELPRVRAELGRLGLLIHGTDRYLHRLASTARGQPIPVDDCGPGRSFLFIDEHGRVS
ncbi:MAG: radical SAM protein, partial [Gemmataceae bacterium]